MPPRRGHPRGWADGGRRPGAVRRMPYLHSGAGRRFLDSGGRRGHRSRWLAMRTVTHGPRVRTAARGSAICSWLEFRPGCSRAAGVNAAKPSRCPERSSGTDHRSEVGGRHIPEVRGAAPGRWPKSTGFGTPMAGGRIGATTSTGEPPRPWTVVGHSGRKIARYSGCVGFTSIGTRQRQMRRNASRSSWRDRVRAAQGICSRRSRRPSGR